MFFDHDVLETSFMTFSSAGSVPKGPEHPHKKDPRDMSSLQTFTRESPGAQ
jgi:hypothetical protein